MFHEPMVNLAGDKKSKNISKFKTYLDGDLAIRVLKFSFQSPWNIQLLLVFFFLWLLPPLPPVVAGAGVSAGGFFLLGALGGLVTSTSFLSRNCFDFLGKANVFTKGPFSKFKMIRPWPDFHFSRICPTCPEGWKKPPYRNIWEMFGGKNKHCFLKTP